MNAPGDRGSVGPDVEWDAGDLGCGELLLQLKRRVRALDPGHVLRVVARDAGAPADMPAGCRLTGHRLIGVEHPTYRIREKED